jgi:hypothetical protein
VCQRVSGSPSDLGYDLPDDLDHEVLRNLHVDYAVDLIVVLRCTQNLLLRLNQFDDSPDAQSTTKLGDWYGNLIRIGNRHVLLFISERSRLPIMIPVREANRRV